jgi:nonribosomal peptide synthetase protein BlmV
LALGAELGPPGGEPAPADVVFGLTLSARPAALPGSEHIVGLLINTVPVRVTFPPHAPVSEWLGGLQEQAAAMADARLMALRHIASASPLRKGQALFETILIYQNYPREPAQGMVSAEPLVTIGRTHYPVTLEAWLEPGGLLRWRLTVDTARVAGQQIEGLSARLRGALLALLDGRDRTVGEVLADARRAG